jgi:signal transduction histidine kinase
VFLDAGGVLCHPSWTRVADALVRHGARVTSSALAAAEQKATRDIDDAHTIGKTDDRARGWLYFNLVLQHAGVTQNAGTDAALVELREYHRHDNLWEHVEPDVSTGKYVFIDVVDNGSGMNEHTLARMFDPFFSTKDTGRGLGMAAVRGIVRSHRAALRVTSAAGQGTRFRVWFPLGLSIHSTSDASEVTRGQSTPS